MYKKPAIVLILGFSFFRYRAFSGFSNAKKVIEKSFQWNNL